MHEAKANRGCAAAQENCAYELQNVQLNCLLIELSFNRFSLIRRHNENIKDAFISDDPAISTGAVRHIEGMKHAETGQLYWRSRAQQPAFLGHNCLTRNNAPKTANRRAGIFPPAANQPFLVMRVISRSTIASTIGGRLVSSQSFSIGRSRSRVSPSSEVSPERTIWGATPGSDKVCNAEKL